jgi:opacity protein-like surface antigen
MKATKRICVTVSFALLLIVTAGNTPAADSDGKGYLTFDGGVTLQRDVTVRDGGGAKASFDPGFRLDAAFGVGTHTPNSWAGEFEFGLIYNSMKPIEALDSEHLDVYEIPLMVNVIYTLPLDGPVTAYIGGGIGAVYGVFAGDGTGILGFSTDVTFGYQGIMGLGYSIGEKAKLGIAYKFLGTTDHDMGAFRSGGTMTHCLLAKLTFTF